MTPTTARALAREAKKQRRMKEHVARWDHQRNCPHCRAGVPHAMPSFSTLQDILRRMPEPEGKPTLN